MATVRRAVLNESTIADTTTSNREIDDAAYEIHGLSSLFLGDKPLFDEIGEKLME